MSPTNFGGADEWLLLDLRRAGSWAFPTPTGRWCCSGRPPAPACCPATCGASGSSRPSYFAATGALTAWLALRLAPGARALALLAGVATVAWAPLDYLRLDTVLIGGYAGVTLAAVAALVLFVEAWHRKKFALLAAGMALALVATLGVESVASRPGRGADPDRRRVARTTRAASGSGRSRGWRCWRPGRGSRSARCCSGWPSYQTGALGHRPPPASGGGQGPAARLDADRAAPDFAPRGAGGARRPARRSRPPRGLRGPPAGWGNPLPTGSPLARRSASSWPPACSSR